MLELIAGLALFVGVHSVSIVAPGLRNRVAERIGVMTWRGIYSIVAIVGLVLIVQGYADLRNQTAVLYASPRWLRGISMLLMVPVFPLLLATYLPGGVKSAARHPMLVAVKLWALSHLFANGSVADVVLFGSVLAWAIADRISLKRRPARAIPTAPSSPWNDVIVVVGGLVLYALMLNFGHRWLIGMPLV